MRGRLLLPALALPAALAGLGGCDPQAADGYPGEPLLVLRGQVEGVAPLPPLEAAMLWQRGPPPSTDDQDLATRAPVEPGFPASFTIRLYQPPPAEARRFLAPGEPSFARGNAAAMPLGTPASHVSEILAPGNPSYGVDVERWIVHLEEDVPASSLTAWWLGAPLPAGYHLLRVTPIDPACVDLPACLGTLVARGVTDDGTADPGTARGFCLAPYRLSPAPPDALLVLRLGTYAPPPETGCP